MVIVIKKKHIVLAFLAFVAATVMTLYIIPNEGSIAVSSNKDVYLESEALCRDKRQLKPQSPALEGVDVVELQISLERAGYYTGEHDGIYSASLIEAVKKLQRDNNLEPNGVVCDDVWEAMFDGKAETKLAITEAPAGDLVLVVDLDKRQLTVLEDGEEYAKFPVTIGLPQSPSPVGDFYVKNKGYPKGSGFGTRWMGLTVPWGGYGIHGTNNPGAIGGHGSAGCIRLFNRDVEKLYEWVDIGTPVILNSQRTPPKFRDVYQKGAGGQAVVYLQRALREKGFYEEPADSFFKEEEEEAVKRLQADYRLPRTGKTDANLIYLLGLR
ncbi:peptidoglycan-binding protein [Proteinivorax hydrogeniformans]|uniref:Peptidoglycan-binding protein n=1 Tax=Proteinivorax hydrogeniformans TaxID=1826727 RepID=A0AAU8HWD0_9FIRM